MAEFSGGRAISAGFRLIGREPVAFLVWSLAFFLIGVLPQVWVGKEMLEGFGAFARAVDESREPGMDEMLAMQTRMLQLQPIYYLTSIVSQTLIFAAVYRAMLSPPERGFFHLRLGVRELWLGLVILVLVMLLFIGVFAMMIPIFIVTAIVAATQNEAAVMLAPVATLACAGVLIWAALRLSLAPVMSFSDNTFRLFESWSVTRGHALKMFGVGLAIMVIIWLLEALLIGAGVAAMMAGAAPVRDFTATFAADPGKALAGLGVGFWATAAVAVSLLSTFFFVMFGAAWASIYRDLTQTAAAEA